MPPQPLGILKALIRAKFDYSVCKGSGAVRLNYDLLFGEFDRLSLNWYKYSGNAPGFDILPKWMLLTDSNIVTSGVAQGHWTTSTGPRLGATLLQELMALRANSSVSDYEYGISNIKISGSNRGCNLKHSGDLEKYFPGPNYLFEGPLKFSPGSDFSWNIVYFCSNVDTTSSFDTVSITFSFEKDLFHPITITFTKDWIYQQFVNIGTSADTPTTSTDVNTQGSPVKGWDFPDSDAGRWKYCGLKKGQSGS